jgi:hypothetical protein
MLASAAKTSKTLLDWYHILPLCLSVVFSEFFWAHEMPDEAM